MQRGCTRLECLCCWTKVEEEEEEEIALEELEMVRDMLLVFFWMCAMFQAFPTGIVTVSNRC